MFAICVLFCVPICFAVTSSATRIEVGCVCCCGNVAVVSRDTIPAPMFEFALNMLLVAAVEVAEPHDDDVAARIACGPGVAEAVRGARLPEERNGHALDLEGLSALGEHAAHDPGGFRREHLSGGCWQIGRAHV